MSELLSLQVPAIAPFLGPDVDAVYALLEKDGDLERYVNRYKISRETVSENSYQVSWGCAIDSNSLELVLSCVLSVQVDLISTFTKFSTLGAPINTEAYTYNSSFLSKK